MAKVKNFKTIFPAVSVPLNEDYSINEPEFRAYLRWIKSFYDQGIEGLVCNGHTGEITGLTRAERKRVTEICSEECGDKMTIISGLNCENTHEAIEMAREAKEAGADGILLMPPHMWLRFGMNPDAPFNFVKEVAEGADIDIIIHLYPATSKAFYPVETLIKMCNEIEHVIATPVAGLFVVLLIWRKDVNKGYKAPTALRICMTLSYIFVLVMTGFAFATSIIPNISSLFGGA